MSKENKQSINLSKIKEEKTEEEINQTLKILKNTMDKFTDHFTKTLNKSWSDMTTKFTNNSELIILRQEVANIRSPVEYRQQTEEAWRKRVDSKLDLIQEEIREIRVSLKLDSS